MALNSKLRRKRQGKLEKNNIQLDRLPLSLSDAVIKDYLTRRKCATGVEEIKQRYKAAEMLITYLPLSSNLSRHLALFESLVGIISRKKLYRLLLDKLQQQKASQKYLVYRRDAVFANLWIDISEYIPSYQDVYNWNDAFPFVSNEEVDY